MNTPNYREEMEIRLVALLLGEASPVEEAELRKAMEKDPFLAAFYAEMKGTVGRVQDAVGGEFKPKADALHLSESRRELLLKSFKIVAVETKQPKIRRWLPYFNFAGVAAVCLLMGVIFYKSSLLKHRPVDTTNIPGHTRVALANLDEKKPDVVELAMPEAVVEPPVPMAGVPVSPSVVSSEVPIEVKSEADNGIVFYDKQETKGKELALGESVKFGAMKGIDTDSKSQTPASVETKPSTLVEAIREGKKYISEEKEVLHGITPEIITSIQSKDIEKVPNSNGGAWKIKGDLRGFYQDDSGAVAKSDEAPVTNQGNIHVYSLNAVGYVATTITNTYHFTDGIDNTKRINKNVSTSDAMSVDASRRSESQERFPARSIQGNEEKVADKQSADSPSFAGRNIQTGKEIQDGRSLSKSGKLEEAETKLWAGIKKDSTNSKAYEYLDLVKEAKYKKQFQLRESLAKNTINGVSSAWLPGQTNVPKSELTQQVAASAKNEAVKRQMADAPANKPSEVSKAPIPQPEVLTRENPISTFSMNVSDVSYKLALAGLQNNVLPDPASIRVEEFVNAFNYRDPAPKKGTRLSFVWEQSHDPFVHNRDIVRFGIQTAASGRESRKPLNLVVLLDNSGSMERADRVAIIQKSLSALARQLQAQDCISVVVFSRTAQLWIDGMSGGNPDAFLKRVSELNPDGGTNLEEAMKLGYETAFKHFLMSGMNRVILLTDGAANLGNLDAENLKKTVVSNRQKGVAFDCYGIGWEGYNDELLETLSRNGDGRYGFLNRPEQAEQDFANQLAGALHVGAENVKAQVEFNPSRVISWRQIGYAKHQLTKEQFRDNTVDAAEIAAAEQGNALYVIEVNPDGNGEIGTMRVRFQNPDTGEYVEQSWLLEYSPRVESLNNSSPAMRLAVSASAFGEWLARSPYAVDVGLSQIESLLSDVPGVYSPDRRPAELLDAVRKARMIEGR